MKASNIIGTDILYDKIVNVELISTLPEDKNIEVILDVGSKLPIVIYRGVTHKEYYRLSDSSTLLSREIKPSGRVLSVPSVPYGKKWWEEGVIDPLKNLLRDVSEYSFRHPEIPASSVAIIVNDHGKRQRYHAMYINSDELNTTAYHAEATTTIECKKGGIKPSISFTTNVIQGSQCYKMVLKITNLNLDMDIRQVKRINVTAGYRNQGLMKRFSCPVFSSYIESPNPDGVTVFECLSVGNLSSFNEDRPVTFKYLGGSITIHDFIVHIAEGLGDNIAVYDYLAKEYQDIQISMSKMDTYAENGTATINWARQIIQKCIAHHEGFETAAQAGSSVAYPYIMMHIDDTGALKVYALNKRNQDEIEVEKKGTKERLYLQYTESVPVLDAIKGATFNGVALTVKAAWNPKVNPGGLFQMQPNIYNGANLPNSLSNSQIGKSKEYDYLYRCITCTISFSTNGDENEMSLLAIPVQYMEDANPVNAPAAASFEDFIKASQVVYDLQNAHHVEFGKATEDTETTPEKEKEDIVISNTNDMFGMDLSLVFGTTTDYVIQDGDNLSSIAYKYYAQGNGFCDFDLYPTHPEDLLQGTNEGKLNARAFLWPIIAVMTYRRKLLMGDVAENNYESMANMKNPCDIKVGNKLAIPVLSRSTLKRCREIFTYAMAAYNMQDFPSYGSWFRDWRACYNYLGDAW